MVLSRVVQFIIVKTRNLLSRTKQIIEVIGFTIFEKFIFNNRVILTYSFISFFVGSLLLNAFPDDFIYNFRQHKHFLLFLVLFFCGIILEIIIKIINKKRQKSKQDFIVPISSRIFTLIPYCRFFLELNKLYYDFAASIFHELCGSNIERLIWIFYTWYDLIPSTIRDLSLYLVFYVFLFGIARNKERFSYFTRYHYAQAIIFSSCSIFINHVFLFMMEFSTNKLIIETLAVFIYSFFCMLIMLGMISIFVGKESNIVFLHQAIVYHVGRKKIKKNVI